MNDIKMESIDKLLNLANEISEIMNSDKGMVGVDITITKGLKMVTIDDGDIETRFRDLENTGWKVKNEVNGWQD